MSASTVADVAHNVCEALLVNLDRHLVYFPKLPSGSMVQSTGSAESHPSVANDVARFRLTPAGLCVNWYTEPSAWFRSINHEVARLSANTERDVTASSSSSVVTFVAPLLMSTWSWNAYDFNRSESSDMMHRVMFGSDGDVTGSKAAVYLHNFMQARVADKLLWSTGDSPVLCNRCSFVSPVSLAQHLTIASFDSSMSSWQDDVSSFVHAYRSYRTQHPNNVDFMLTGTSSSMSVGERIWRASENLSASRLVTTVLEKLLHAAAGLFGLVNVSIVLFIYLFIIFIYVFVRCVVRPCNLTVKKYRV